MTTKAIRDGDEYVINGTKRFITNGPVAGMYLCIATVDPSLPDALATRAFLVPAGAPGLSVGTLENKMGHRLSITSEIIFEDVRVPAEDELPGGAAALRFGLECSNTMVGALSVGVARAAYEEAMAYAKVRYKGGNRIIFHQAVGMMLADMAIAIKTARLLVHQSRGTRQRGGTQPRGGDGEGLPLRRRGEGDARRGPDLRRLRLHARSSAGEVGPRCARDADLRLHERDAPRQLHPPCLAFAEV
jgi:alkylation response protein AidB-like acyl-CoA dehydrogenase